MAMAFSDLLRIGKKSQLVAGQPANNADTVEPRYKHTVGDRIS